ncbi:HNH endonuclease signature motif containing protein [Pseudonocardia alni]|uniref:HNH endonuclease signature motif containing protein n=1 Tax=Pseudonocardia alni TaxID=33907 RepID=UPI00332EABC5
MRPTRRTKCVASTCTSAEHARGYCRFHYRMFLGTSVLPRLPKPTAASRLNERTGAVDPRTGCRPWTGQLSKAGYGVFTLGRGRHFYAHRVAWEKAHGKPIPTGMQVDHECHNRDSDCGGGACAHRACVNPDHLAVVTSAVNARRSAHTQQSVNRSKTHCIRNHPFDAQNTYYRPNGMRNCRTCANERRRARGRNAATSKK